MKIRYTDFDANSAKVLGNTLYLAELKNVETGDDLVNGTPIKMTALGSGVHETWLEGTKMSNGGLFSITITGGELPFNTVKTWKREEGMNRLWSLSPIAPLGGAFVDTNNIVVVTRYEAVVDGTGYVKGDVIEKREIITISLGQKTASESWINIDTGVVLASPPPYTDIDFVSSDSDSNIIQEALLDVNAGVVTPFLRTYAYSESGVVLQNPTDTELDGTAAYNATGTVTTASYKIDNQRILLADNNSGVITLFIRNFVYDNLDGDILPQDTELDGITSYNVTGEVGVPGETGYTLTKKMFDIYAETVYQFIRIYSFEDGSVQKKDVELDGVTIYSVSGESNVFHSYINDVNYDYKVLYEGGNVEQYFIRRIKTLANGNVEITNKTLDWGSYTIEDPFAVRKDSIDRVVAEHNAILPTVSSLEKSMLQVDNKGRLITAQNDLAVHNSTLSTLSDGDTINELKLSNKGQLLVDSIPTGLNVDVNSDQGSAATVTAPYASLAVMIETSNSGHSVNVTINGKTEVLKIGGGDVVANSVFSNQLAKGFEYVQNVTITPIGGAKFSYKVVTLA